MMIILKEMSMDIKDDFIEFASEYKSTCGEEVISFALNPNDKPFEEFLKGVLALSDEENLPEGFVPTKYYLVYDNTKVVGAINLRYKDSDFILNYAGHIGYCILPSMRGKGYATRALSLMLEKAQEMGMHRVVLTANKDNLASQHVIEANQGVLEENKDGNENKLFYYIEL